MTGKAVDMNSFYFVFAGAGGISPSIFGYELHCGWFLCRRHVWGNGAGGYRRRF